MWRCRGIEALGEAREGVAVDHPKLSVRRCRTLFLSVAGSGAVIPSITSAAMTRSGRCSASWRMRQSGGDADRPADQHARAANPPPAHRSCPRRPLENRLARLTIQQGSRVCRAVRIW